MLVLLFRNAIMKQRSKKMDGRIRILCIAHYENMRSVMYAVAKEFPQIEITVYVGDLDVVWKLL